MATAFSRFSLTALTVIWAGTCPAQTAAGPNAAPPLRVDVNLVLVPVTVTDRSGKVLSGLDRSRFRIFEEGVPQPIASFSTEDLPASIGLVLDVSGSMRQKLSTARSFIRPLLAGTEYGDEALFLTCADRPDLQADLTHNIDGLRTILESARPAGWTALADAIYLTIDRIQAARNPRKVLVIVSDGQDNHSRYSKSELLSRAIESESQIYSVATPGPRGSRKAIELVEENRGLAFLSDLARSTGGLYFQIDNQDAIARAAGEITSALHHQYLIGYYPTQPLRKGLRRIQVKLDIPDVRLYARNLYHATSP